MKNNWKALIDFNNIAYASFFVDVKRKGNSLNGNENFLRHLILSNLLYFKRKLDLQSKNMILCIDSKENWRRDVFSYYKAHRKKARDESDIDFEILFKVIDEMYEDFQKYFPFIVLKVAPMEADDLVAIITKKIRNDYIIISRDRDFQQLQMNDNVIFQYDPIAKKRLEFTNHKKELIFKILRGDSGDGVPNIKSDDDTFVTEGKRQKRFGEKEVWGLIEENRVKSFIKENNLIKNWKRNNRLINLSKIPEQFYDPVINAFLKYQPVLNKAKLMAHLKKNKLNKLMNRVRDFYD